MEIIHRPAPAAVWLKAAVVASYWASFEIIAGSFLHNLRMPLSGTILSFVSVILLVVFASVWKQRGLIWRAGLICALLKSISPSAIILGPMVGIFIEALLLELTTSIFGYNLIAFMAGGALAVFSALLHKVITLLIMYGFDLIRIIEALYRYAVRQIHLEQLGGETVLLILTGIYLAAGIIAACTGYFIGRKIRKQEPADSHIHTPGIDSSRQYLTRQGAEKYSVWLLLLNLAAVIGLLYLINLDLILLAVGLSGLYLLFIGLRYRSSFRHLRKPGFWIQFVLLTLVAALLLNGLTNGVFFSKEGLIVGLNMNLRAIIVIVSFSAISTELRNPLIRALTVRSGMAELYQSVNLAFSALPAIIQSFPGLRALVRSPLGSLAGLFIQSQNMVELFEREIQKRSEVVILSGQRQEGKTTFLQELLPELRNRDIFVTGFLAPAVHENGRRIGFNLLGIESGESMVLCRERQANDNLGFRRFVFNQDALKQGEAILNLKNLRQAQLVIIDEVGPLELKNEGWTPSIKELCRNSGTVQLWAVRKQMVQQVASAWQVGDVHVFQLAETSPEEMADYIQNLVSKNGDTFQAVIKTHS